jgi:hypothetical protein
MGGEVVLHERDLLGLQIDLFDQVADHASSVSPALAPANQHRAVAAQRLAERM